MREQRRYGVLLEACAAALRRQSRHRQSSPSRGIFSRTSSSAHQQVSDCVQENFVPHWEQTMRREGFSKQFVMNASETLPGFSGVVHRQCDGFRFNAAYEFLKRTRDHHTGNYISSSSLVLTLASAAT